MVFVSGVKSSNGKVLFEVCRKHNPNTYFISSSSELNLSMFAPGDKIGIAGATSTPMWLMEEVKAELEKILQHGICCKISMPKQTSFIGLFVALAVIGCWVTSIILLMRWHINFANPLTYLFMLLQMHLYTGLFITAHDAMHGTVSPNRRVNNLIGYTCTFLYALFWYPQLYTKHHLHHSQVHTDTDPDYHRGGFLSWYFNFIKNYLSIWQVIAMAILFNILKLWIPQANLLLFWVVPSLLSTLQLFYFGTYQPHKGEHNNQHHSRSQPRNHISAFFSCYFFGYHYEHHDAPGVPWWRLWKQQPHQD